MTDFDVLCFYTNRLFYDSKLVIFNILAENLKCGLPRECIREYCLSSIQSAFIHYVFDFCFQYNRYISVGIVFDSFDSCYDSFIKDNRLEIYDFLENHGIRQDIIF